MSPYRYSSLLPGPDSIRLLRLMPHEDKTAPIQCQLVNYSLQESGGGTHLYEALSYVWGDPKETFPISIDKHELSVTVNLHAALSRLRDRCFERIIWVDAVCINQEDRKEKEHQIQSMAKIYGQANRVIVWLGEAKDNSDQALEDIRVAAEDDAGGEFTNSPNDEKSQEAILKLLRRPWFRRIWVLQEVAAARRVLIMCGPAEINGYAFCSGFNKLKLSYGAHPDLQGLIRSVTYVIKGAIFRPKYATSSLGGISLGELIDMYHTREATERHDKVYALFGMSSDDPSAAGLSPNYKVPWKKLLQQLVKFILCKEVYVETWDEKEIAVIKSKGCILGQVSWVESDGARYDRQHVAIIFKNKPRSLEYEKKWGAQWTLQASAKSIRQGDLVCLLQGASKPIIIRTCKDNFTVIKIAVTLQQGVRPESGYVERQGLLPSMKSFPRDFLLVWNWEELAGNLRDRVDAPVPEHLMTTSNKAARLYDVALILGDSEEYEEARKRLQEATESHEGTPTKEHPHKLAGMENLALIHKKNKQWKEAEKILLQVIEIRKLVHGIDHLDTLSSIANLASTYIDQGDLSTVKLEIMEDLVYKIRDNVQILEEEVVQVIRSFGKEMLTLLLNLRRDNVLITKGVVKAVAEKEWGGKEIMALLLDRRGGDAPITKGVVKAAAGNWESGKEIMALLLNRRGGDAPITEGVAEAAAGNERSGKEIMALLLDRGGGDVPITEEVVKAAAGNKRGGKEIMALLLDRRGGDIPITKGVVEAAAGNWESGKEIMALLLDRRGGDIPITEVVVKAAAGKEWGGKEIMALLLDRGGGDVPITEGVVAQIARNFGKEIMALLLDRRGGDVPITKGVVKAAAGNEEGGKEIMALLLDQRGGDVLITEGVVEAAARNKVTGKEIMALLLDQRGGDVPITEGVAKAVAGNGVTGKEIMALLLDRRGGDVPITEGVVKAAAGNGVRGKEIMALLLDRRGGDVPITEGVVKAAARNFGKEIMALLLDRRGGDVPITEGVVEAAAGNWGEGKEIMALLLNQRGGDVPITEGVVKAAVGNILRGKEIMALLLDQRGGDVPITEGVVKAAGMDQVRGKEIMALLLDRRGGDVLITEGVVKAVARYVVGGKEITAPLLDRRGATSDH